MHRRVIVLSLAMYPIEITAFPQHNHVDGSSLSPQQLGDRGIVEG
ncbi:hypothetical protein [Stenomitos frigidus]|nr:hypothetical protein [Stenomitos frigidus]